MLAEPIVTDNNYVHSLPPFANQENKDLSKKIRDMEQQLRGLEGLVDDNHSRGSAILAHIKNVHSESTHTQALYEAKNRQIETEEHLKQLAEGEIGRLTIQMKHIDSEMANTASLLNILQTNIYKGNEKIEAIKAEFKLETEELNEWLRVQGEKEEDTQALAKYTKEDETKEKELSISIEKMVDIVNKRKAQLLAEVTETQVAQIELENTTIQFKKLHSERKELIENWKKAVATMKQRDIDINNSHETYSEQKQQMKKIQDKIKESNEIYTSQKKYNEETENNIIVAERKLAQLKEEFNQARKSIQDYRDEVENVKTASDLVNRRSLVQNLHDNLKSRKIMLETSSRTIDELKMKLESLLDKSVSLDDRAKQLEELLRAEKAKENALEKETRQAREMQFKKSQHLFALKQEEKNTEAEIYGSKAALRNMKTKLAKLDQDTLKQKAMLYSMGYSIQQLERKIRRCEGDRTDEEKAELNAKIEKLTARLDQEQDRYNMLNSQFKLSQEQARRSKRTVDKLEKEKQDLETNIGELNLYNDSSEHQLAAKVRERENLMVEENILRLELRRLKSYLHARSDEVNIYNKVMTLETRKLQLSLGLEERKKEIDIHKSMLKIHIKNAEEERHSACAELRDRVSNIEILKSRYEIIMTQFAPDEGEEEHTQAYYVIKAAQKREELQKDGDELDAKIRKAEKEIKALENTLKMMNSRNEQFRMNLYKAELDGGDLQHKELLETEYKKVMDTFKLKRSEIQELQFAVQMLESNLKLETTKESDRLQKIHLLQTKIEAIMREINDQSVKKNRAIEFVLKSAKRLRNTLGSKGHTPIEEDFIIRCLKEISIFSLKDLGKFSERFPDLRERVSAEMELAGLQPPSRSVSRVSSRASSIDGGSGRSSRAETPTMNVSYQENTGKPIEPLRSKSNSTNSVKPKTLNENTKEIAKSTPKLGSRSNSALGSSIQNKPISRSNSVEKTSSRTSLGKLDKARSVSGKAPSRSNSISSIQSASNQVSNTPLAVSTEPKSPKPRITGQGRIKQPSRPGSASSNSSKGSRK